MAAEDLDRLDDLTSMINVYREKRAKRLRQMAALQDNMAKETDQETLNANAELFDRLRIEEKNLQEIIDTLLDRRFPDEGEDAGTNLH